MLFLRFVDGLRQSILPILISILAREVWLAIATGVFFVLGLAFAVARYLTFQYRLTDDELVTTEGILHRQERRIPIDRIQDLSFESTLLRRVFGLVVVRVETASGQGAEATLDSLSRRDAGRLREVLYSLRSRGGVAEAEAAERPPEELLFRSTGGELTLLGLTNNRAGAILLALFGIFELSDQLGLGGAVVGLFGGFVERLSMFGTPLVAVFFVGMLFLFLAAGWALSVTASLVMYHGFVLSEREDVLYRRYGLITTRAQSLPRRKIQRVTIEAPLVRRLCGTASLRADSAGAGASEPGRQSANAERDVIAPLAAVGRAEDLVPRILLGMASEPLPWRRVSPRVVVRVFLKGVLLGAAVLAAGLPTVGLPALVGLLALPIAWAVGTLLFANLAYARVPGHVAFRWGLVGRYRAFVPLRKVQGIVLRAGPVERLLGLAHVTVFVAGGSPTTLGNLPRDEAEGLVFDVAHEAAASRFVW
jgi:putative membrane protein